jgi:hypothetical protein
MSDPRKGLSMPRGNGEKAWREFIDSTFSPEDVARFTATLPPAIQAAAAEKRRGADVSTMP